MSGMTLPEMTQYYYEQQIHGWQTHDQAIRRTRGFLTALGEPLATVDTLIAGIERKPARRSCSACGEPWDGVWAIYVDSAGRDWCDVCWAERTP